MALLVLQELLEVSSLTLAGNRFRLECALLQRLLVHFLGDNLSLSSLHLHNLPRAVLYRRLAL